MKKDSYKIQLTSKDYIKFNYKHTDINKLVDDSKVTEMISKKLESLFKGDKVNFTENEKVLFWATRKRSVLKAINNKFEENKTEKAGEIPFIEEEKEIIEEFKKLETFVTKIRKGELKSFSGKNFDTVINIGIGGSDLGNRLLGQSLSYKDHLKLHFISNVDPTSIYETLKNINIETTLFVVVSKTWSTKETLENARIVKEYICEKFNNIHIKDISKNFISVSARPDLSEKFGTIENFKIWGYFGGRFSVWSAVGISIALSYGFDVFTQFLSGANTVDESVYHHLKEKTLGNSVFMAQSLLELHYMKEGYSKCVVPYSEYMKYYYQYLQQLEMESNGKKQSNMVIWGGIGTDVQHSFFQMIHQGDKKILTEFIVPMSLPKELMESDIVKNSITLKSNIKQSHKTLIANCLAQSKSFWDGKKNEDINQHFEGGKPNILQSVSSITPEVLGGLLAFNEIKVIIQGFILEINSFDQFGVALGKKVANDIESVLGECIDQIKEGKKNISEEVKDDLNKIKNETNLEAEVIDEGLTSERKKVKESINDYNEKLKESYNDLIEEIKDFKDQNL